jgi:hypothetical protein
MVALLAVSEYDYLFQVEELRDQIDSVSHLVDVNDTRFVVHMGEDKGLTAVGNTEHTEGICRRCPFRAHNIRTDDGNKCLHIDY